MPCFTGMLLAPRVVQNSLPLIVAAPQTVLSACFGIPRTPLELVVNAVGADSAFSRYRLNVRWMNGTGWPLPIRERGCLKLTLTEIKVISGTIRPVLGT